MLDPPDLPEERIAAAVRRRYALRLTTLAFLPVGQDVLTWNYRATSADAAYFLKLHHGAVNEVGLRVPRFLADQGVPHIVAPLPALTGALWGEVDGYTLMLYPFIEGTTGGTHGLQEHHWATYGAALRAIHETSLSPDLLQDVPHETFVSRWSEVVRAVAARIARRGRTDPIERDLAAFWQQRGAQIQALVSRLERLGQRLRATPPPLVLCHADVHHNNVLIDSDGRFWIVDWDDTQLAPKECDLMMGVGGLRAGMVGPREEAWFLQGYGRTDIDVVALAYYRHVRAVGDLGYNAQQIVLMPNVSDAARRNALERTRLLFAPSYIVDLAGQLDRIVGWPN